MDWWAIVFASIRGDKARPPPLGQNRTDSVRIEFTYLSFSLVQFLRKGLLSAGSCLENELFPVSGLVDSWADSPPNGGKAFVLGIALTTFPHVYHSSKKKNKIARVLILINPTSDYSSLDLFPGPMGERGKQGPFSCVWVVF